MAAATAPAENAGPRRVSVRPARSARSRAALSASRLPAARCGACSSVSTSRCTPLPTRGARKFTNSKRCLARGCTSSGSRRQPGRGQCVQSAQSTVSRCYATAPAATGPARPAGRAGAGPSSSGTRAAASSGQSRAPGGCSASAASLLVASSSWPCPSRGTWSNGLRPSRAPWAGAGACRRTLCIPPRSRWIAPIPTAGASGTLASILSCVSSASGGGGPTCRARRRQWTSTSRK
mmetsp:Transcript_58133/g.154521  ORF Transcript_58133/g.154521 Transcript_58133/m.154521 type:complete len:235 (+) Transcript_58133:1063-1767(+)